MKKLTIAALSLAAALAFAGCAPGHDSEGASPTAAAETQAFRSISPEEARELIGKENVVLLDVRTQEEYDEGHIEGAELLPYDAITAESAGLPADKDAALIIYCRSGRRSAIAAQTLSELGYTRVYDLGGIQDWPYEIVK
jgi:phage shock protein E